MKPYRFLTTEEKNQIIDSLKDGLSQWSETYACEQINLQVHFSKPEMSKYHSCLQNDTGASVGFISGDLEALITQTVFQSEKSEDFVTVLKQLTAELFSQTLGESIHYKNSLTCSDPKESGYCHIWFCLRNGRHSIDILLDSAWVFNRWIKFKKNAVRPMAVEKAIEHNALSCEVKLETFCLSIDAIKKLKPGDVILTDQALSTAMKIVVGNNTLAKGTLGKVNQQKSIKIRSIV